MIDKIDGLGSVRTAVPVKRAVKTDSSGGTVFAKHLDEGAETSAPVGISAPSSVSGILGVQEVDDALAHAARGKMRAEDILNRLDDMRLDLLAGGLSKEKLMQLSRIVNARRAQKITDPRLAALLDDIDLRAQVELAKYT